MTYSTVACDDPTTTSVVRRRAGGTSDPTARNLAASVSACLMSEYGPIDSRRVTSPTDCLLATILSQHTSDRNSAAAFSALKEHFPDSESLLDVSVDDLANTIRVAGLARSKARHIKASLRALADRFGTLDLTFLRELSSGEAREVLEALPGVGPKTASCVLLFSCGHQVLPVDTHVHRLALRLGLVPSHISAEGAQDMLEDIVPPQDRYAFHVNLIRHGRLICRAREPMCGNCLLQPLCAYYQSDKGHLS